MKLSIVPDKTLTAWCMFATPSISCNGCTAGDVAMASCGVNVVKLTERPYKFPSARSSAEPRRPPPRPLQNVSSQPHIYIQMCKFQE